MEKMVGSTNDWLHSFADSILNLNRKITNQMSSNDSKSKFVCIFWSGIDRREIVYLLCKMSNEIKTNDEKQRFQT